MKYLMLIAFILSVLTSCSSQTVREHKIPKFKVNKELFPYQQHYLKLENGSLIHYVDEGDGPVLLLLHGNPTWSFLYRDIIEDLKDDFRVIAPDYPGFGLSYAPESYKYTAAEQAESMVAFFNKMKLDNVIVMVQDWGGPIGFAIAENAPERIQGFIIGNTWAWPLDRIGGKFFSTMVGGWPGQFSAWCCDGVVHLFMTLGIETEISDDELDMYLAPFQGDGAYTPTHIFPAQLWDADIFLQEVYSNFYKLKELPVLIVWGTEDFAFQEHERKRFEEIFPKHQTVLLNKTSHFIQEDSASEISKKVRSWHSETFN